MSKPKPNDRVTVREQGGTRTYDVSLDVSPSDGLVRLDALAEAWGAQWRPEGTGGGHLTLPVRAGVRRGMVAGTVSVHEAHGGSRLQFDVEEAFYRVQYAAFFLLTLGAFGGLTTVVAPFKPAILPIVPIGLMLAVASWFLIVARLTNSGAEEFFGELATVEDRVETE